MQRRTTIFLLAATIVAAGLVEAAAPAPAPRIRGTIQSLEGSTLIVEPRDGDAVKVSLAPNYAVNAIFPTTLDAVKPGVMVGIVGFGPSKQQRAAVVSIFPPGSGASELQMPWDSEPDSVMTNAPVNSVVAATSGRVLSVTMKGEPIEVTVPPNAIIQTSEPGTPAMLTPGAKVLIFVQRGPDGALSANRINVGKDGFTPAN